MCKVDKYDLYYEIYNIFDIYHLRRERTILLVNYNRVDKWLNNNILSYMCLVFAVYSAISAFDKQYYMAAIGISIDLILFVIYIKFIVPYMEQLDLKIKVIEDLLLKKT